MARKIADEKRDKFLVIRVSESEQRQLHELKTGKELATWARKTLLRQSPPPKPNHPKIDPQFLKEMHRQGVNLNQLAKHINRLSDDKEKIPLLFYLKNVDNNQRKIIELAEQGYFNKGQSDDS